MLIVFGGLPGSGKTTVSRELARRMAATWLRVDAIEAAIGRSGARPVGTAGYAVAAELAAAQLALGGTVIVDAVHPVAVSRSGWPALAAEHGAAARFVEVVCADPAALRRRVEQRLPDLTGHTPPTWAEVQALPYEPWTGPRLTVDTSGTDPLPEILAYLQS
ncbi:AAA family ATPase [Longispora albida]|uniref:AAA family ATPase n=1 Tax=Longispora albida TaxID=203523 RepID=UPI00037CEB46|nr:AAA family ATPase [Longispora albida]